MSSSRTATFSRIRWFRYIERKWYTTSNRASRSGWSTAVMSTSEENFALLSSRRNSTKLTSEDIATCMVSSSQAISHDRTQSGRFSSIWVASSVKASVMGGSPRDGAGAADLPLKLEDAIEQRLRRRRAARHVDVDRHDAVTAPDHRIGIVIVAPA